MCRQRLLDDDPKMSVFIQLAEVRGCTSVECS
jgi:hypothetical protein